MGVSNTFASYAFCGLLLAFFVSSSLLTRVSSGFKKRYDAEHKKGGQRDWVQVACNGGVPSVLACLYIAATSCGHAPFLHGYASALGCAQSVFRVTEALYARSSIVFVPEAACVAA